MQTKIQGGGGGAYANKGSSTGIVKYLEHESAERVKQGQPLEYFFDQERDQVRSMEVIKTLDENRAKLSREDAKFFVVTIAPSQEEIKAMGATHQERAASFKAFIRNEVIQHYAQGFNKGLEKEDIVYFAKVHHTRGDKPGEQMHAHIVISRKDRSNKRKLSPATNHKGKSRGAVKSGFNRVDFYTHIEKSFDKNFNFTRDYKQSFEYQNAIKKGNIKDIQAATRKAVLKPPALEKSAEIAKTIKKDLGKAKIKGLGL